MIRLRDEAGRAVAIPEPSSKRAWHYRAQKFKADACQGDGQRHDRQRPLHVHHKDHNYRNCDPSNLITLCEWCHAKAHGKKPRQMGWLRLKKENQSMISSAPTAMLFGQPWHVIKEQLPAPLAAEMKAWIENKEPNELPPNGLIPKLYDAYLKAKIEIFPR